MQPIPKEQALKRFQALPESLQDTIFSEKLGDTIAKGCQLRDVPEDNISIVGRLAGRVLLGYLQPESFAFEIQKETGIDALKATQIAHDIDTEIFSAVRLELKKLYPPTIQTPTVQSQGFVRSQPVVAEQPKPAPRYIVPIPERFRKTASPSQISAENLGGQATPSSQKTNGAPASTPTPVPEQKPAVSAPSPSKISSETLSKQVAPPPSELQDSNFKIQEPAKQATSYKLQADASPPMDPVVPLPTFIQSKFKQGLPDQPKKEGMPSAPPASDALKPAFGKFTTPSTATGVIKEPESPYREKIEETKKPAEQKPSAKVQGKVIDLSQF